MGGSSDGGGITNNYGKAGNGIFKVPARGLDLDCGTSNASSSICLKQVTKSGHNYMSRNIDGLGTKLIAANLLKLLQCHSVPLLARRLIRNPDHISSMMEMGLDPRMLTKETHSTNFHTAYSAAAFARPWSPSRLFHNCRVPTPREFPIAGRRTPL